ncbi:hypothetical protein [Leifsonia sp. AG29]|uniref:hypothetical protein n=1 Tax=Leifsonia sp. AG29 TaxID=2598860 RepID=UPI001E3A4738|nr:hypothetical protein [Leifsonia sp. AG29]
MHHDAFRSADAIASGMPLRTVYGAQLHRPFRGVRTVAPPDDHRALCAAAALVLPEAAVFSHRSAAVLHGLPLPAAALPAAVEVSVFEPARPPRRSGVVAHQLKADDHRLGIVRGLRVMSPHDTWAQLSSRLRLPDLVVMGDHLITGDQPYSGAPPRCTRADLEAAVRRHGLRRGVRTLRLALERVRYGSLSPQETLLRLALEDAGLPSPSLNHSVTAPGKDRTRAMIDLAYPSERVGVEYLGDHHRTDKRAYREDIARREWLVERGWQMIYVTAADDFNAVARRVRHTLARHSPSSSPHVLNEFG